MSGIESDIDIRDVFGLRPLIPGLKDAYRAIRGNSYRPPNRWGITSVKIFKPLIGLPTWLRHTRRDKLTPIYNFFNRVPQPREEGYSVRVTYCRDFQGGNFTYDGHLGTDFAVPVATTVVAAAPGLVLRVKNDLDHGGLKVCLDHGQGLFTTSSHLSKALVNEGETVRRGQPVGLSGASGIEFILFFPWVAPHLHYNVWLNTEPTDPFAVGSEASMWRQPNDPVPHEGAPVPEDADFTPSEWDADAVEQAIAACRDPAIRARMEQYEYLPRRAAEVLVRRNYQSALFDAFPQLYEELGDRRPCLDLPFQAQDFVGAKLPG